MMRILLVIVVLAVVTNAFAQSEEYIEEGSTTRAIQECEPIIAINKKNNKKIKAEKCFYGFGGIGYDPNNPPVFYYVGDKEVEEDDFLKNYTAEPKKMSAAEESQYKCDGKNGNDMQCLICNCFYETGADGNTGKNISYEERVMVARVVTSRVLNPKFANSVCGVIHERSNNDNRAQFSWIRVWDDNCAEGKTCDKNNPNDPNHKINAILSPPTEHDSSPKARLIRSCTKAAKEALSKKKEYFASYYLTPAAEQVTSWAKECREMYPTLDNRVAAASSGESLSHVFYRSCSEEERVLAGLTYAPKVSVRPRKKPTVVPTSGSKRPRANPARTEQGTE